MLNGFLTLKAPPDSCMGILNPCGYIAGRKLLLQLVQVILPMYAHLSWFRVDPTMPCNFFSWGVRGNAQDYPKIRHT